MVKINPICKGIPGEYYLEGHGGSYDWPNLAGYTYIWTRVSGDTTYLVQDTVNNVGHGLFTYTIIDSNQCEYTNSENPGYKVVSVGNYFTTYELDNNTW